MLAMLGAFVCAAAQYEVQKKDCFEPGCVPEVRQGMYRTDLARHDL